MKSSEELVQILGVGVSILEDERFGQADNSQSFQAGPILAKIVRERRRQDAKWGPQHHTAEEWAMVLVEELGEWAGSVLAESKGLDGEPWTILMTLHRLEDRAREWLELHKWNDRQQEVLDLERSKK